VDIHWQQIGKTAWK